MAVLEVKNIRKRFGKEEILRGIDFSLEEGAVTAIIGSSGSGKTTLLRCLNGLEAPDEGQIAVNGQKLFDACVREKVSVEEMRRNRLQLGFVFQAFHLFPQYCVKRNITLAAELLAKENLAKQYGRRIPRAELKKAYADIDARAEELLKEMGLFEKKDAYPCQLSGGQKQRVAIARAMINEPAILCFDEPTSALDPELTGEVLRVLRGLRSAGKTMVIVTHDMEFARNVADDVIFMADGVIAERGKAEELFANPKSEKLQSFLRITA